MRYIKTVLKSFVTSGLTLAGLTLAGCQRIEPQEGRIESGEDFVVTATIADEDVTKLSLVEDGNDLHPRWSVGDNVLGWDASGATYGLTVSRIVDGGRSAVMNLITSGSNAGTVTSSSSIADGTLIHLVYAPGLTPSSVSDKTLTCDLSTQTESTVPALMTASATVRASGGKATMSAVFHNRVAILSLKNLVMGDAGRAYSSIKVSGPTTTTLNTKITFSISQDGLKAEYGTGGTITKAVSFTSTAAGIGPAGPIHIALCPVETATALTLSTDNCEVCSVNAATYLAGTSTYPESPAFGHPWVEIGGVKWATMNVGATTVAGEHATCAGDWFAWGATEPWYGKATWGANNARSVTFSDWSNDGGYKAANTPYYSGSAYTKYNSTDGLTTLDAADDAATAAWGGGWRMPTKAEFEALKAACGGGTVNTSTKPTSMSATSTQGVYYCDNFDGVWGYLFVADADHKLFLPGGSFVENTTWGGTYNVARYWSSTGSGTNACRVNMGQSGALGQFLISNVVRNYGMTVRPVVNELTGYEGGEASEDLPDGVLPGVFTVAPGDLVGNPVRVRFSKGNLYWNGSTFNFESSQTAYPTSWSTSHVGHFYWTKTAAASYAQSYSDGTCTASDIFFTDNCMLTVGSASNLFVLSIYEWDYLLQTRTKATDLRKFGVTIGSVAGCLVIAPDDYPGTIAASYTTAEWQSAEAAGLVCLPLAGYRDGTTFKGQSTNGLYWSATPYDSNNAYPPGFNTSGNWNISYAGRGLGYAIRLVTSAD